MKVNGVKTENISFDISDKEMKRVSEAYIRSMLGVPKDNYSLRYDEKRDCIISNYQWRDHVGCEYIGETIVLSVSEKPTELIKALVLVYIELIK